MRKFALLLVLVVLAALPLMGAAQDEEIAPWVCPEGFAGQTLSVFNWTTYVAEDTISNFEAACGVRVIYDTYESGEALLARLAGGNPGYDVVVPPNYLVPQMIDRGLLMELDHSLIPNLANLDDIFLDTEFDPGSRFSVAYQWGTIGVGYNRTVVGFDITTWDDVFAYQGPVAWLEDLRSMIGVGLLKLGFDPNSEDPAEIAAARDYLVANGRNVVSIAGDDGQAQLERGDVHIAVEFNGDIFQLIADCECEDYVYVIPEEGAPVWVDQMAIATGAPNPRLAHAFIDYILHPQVGADISNYTAFASPNRVAIELGLVDAEMLANPGIYPTDEVQERLFFVIDVPDAEQFYNDAWDEIKILIAR